MTIYSIEEDKKIIKLYTEEKLGVAKIAKLTHHDPALVSQVLHENGIWIRGSRNFTDEEEAKIAKRYLAGESAKAIARSLGLNHHISICAALKRQGIEQRPKSERNRLYALNTRAFDVIDSEAAAYWLMFLYADGSVSRRTLSLTLKEEDYKHLGKLKDFMKSESPIAIQKRKVGGRLRGYAHIEFTDQHLANQLKGLGIVKGRPDYLSALNAIPGELYHHALRGFWDGDGGAPRNPNQGISFCGKEDFLIWIRAHLALKVGTNPNLKVSKHSKAKLWYLRYSGRRQALEVLDYLYWEATIWLERKRKRVDSWPPPQPKIRNEKGRFI